jgi:hypothetical protein
MGRKLRIQYPGAIYHVMNRSDHQEAIFGDDEDRKLFMATLAEGCQKTAWRWRKGHAFKVMLAARLRAESTVTVGWIAERLAMGTRGHLAHLL